MNCEKLTFLENPKQEKSIFLLPNYVSFSKFKFRGILSWQSTKKSGDKENGHSHSLLILYTGVKSGPTISEKQF